MIDLLFVLIGYSIGAIPTGWLLAYQAGIDDITIYGSGNIGATNVGRLLGLRYFFIVLLIDCLKASLFLLAFQHCSRSSLLVTIAAIAVLLGNSISFFLQGKGGKGIATSLGILLAFNPTVILYLCCVWLPVAAITRNMGISCAAALVMLPFSSWLVAPGDTNFIMLSFFISMWGLWRHENNIRRYFASKKAKI